jgi:hypothetical protein
MRLVNLTIPGKTCRKTLINIPAYDLEELCDGVHQIFKEDKSEFLPADIKTILNFLRQKSPKFGELLDVNRHATHIYNAVTQRILIMQKDKNVLIYL